MGATIREALRLADGKVPGDIDFTDVARLSVRRNILERGLAAIDTKFPKPSGVRAGLLQSLADIFVELGFHEEAAGPQDEALAIRTKLLGEEHRDTLASLAKSAVVLMYLERFDLAREHARRALAGFERTAGRRPGAVRRTCASRSR